MNSIIGLILFLLPFLLIYGAYQFHLIDEGKAFYFNKIKWKTHVSRKRYHEIDDILNKRISFYKHLSNNGKAKFVNRICHLLSIKKFVAKNKLILTEEIKIVVCAALVQLTFGLSEYRLDNIKGFVIHPTIFYHSFIKKYLKGGTPPEGMMLLSWEMVVPDHILILCGIPLRNFLAEFKVRRHQRA